MSETHTPTSHNPLPYALRQDTQRHGNTHLPEGCNHSGTIVKVEEGNGLWTNWSRAIQTNRLKQAKIPRTKWKQTVKTRIARKKTTAKPNQTKNTVVNPQYDPYLIKL